MSRLCTSVIIPYTLLLDIGGTATFIFRTLIRFRQCSLLGENITGSGVFPSRGFRFLFLLQILLNFPVHGYGIIYEAPSFRRGLIRYNVVLSIFFVIMIRSLCLMPRRGEAGFIVGGAISVA